MHATNAFISIMEIVNSWLLKKVKHDNSKWMIIPLAQEAIQELALTSLPMVQHKLLTRPEGQNWFDLPADFTATVSAGIRSGQIWQPIGMSNVLMPMGANSSGGDLNASEFGSDLQTNGAQQNWGNGSNSAAIAASFDDEDFSSADFETEGVSAGASTPGYGGWWRADTVAFNITQGQILVHNNFPGTELYLVYVGVGSVDTMTHIPIIAQAAIEAYIDWKYIQNKRNGIREGEAFRKLYNKQHQILRARLNPLTPTDVKQLRNQQWYQRRQPELTMAATNAMPTDPIVVLYGLPFNLPHLLPTTLP